eukprot:1405855-Rhodomonas_salina.1
MLPLRDRKCPCPFLQTEKINATSLDWNRINGCKARQERGSVMDGLCGLRYKCVSFTDKQIVRHPRWPTEFL